MSKGGTQERRDVLIKAPPAVWPPSKAPAGLVLKEEIDFLRDELRRVSAEYQSQKIAAESLAQISVCLVKAVQDSKGASFEVPVYIDRETYEKMYDTEISIRGDADGNLTITYSSTAPHPVVERRGN